MVFALLGNKTPRRTGTYKEAGDAVAREVLADWSLQTSRALQGLLRTDPAQGRPSPIHSAGRRG